jgi:hypothetical protein
MKFLYGRNEESSGISVVDNVFHGVMDEEGCGAIREKFAVLSKGVLGFESLTRGWIGRSAAG